MFERIRTRLGKETRTALILSGCLAVSLGGLVACGIPSAPLSVSQAKTEQQQLTVLQTDVENRPLTCVRDLTGYNGLSCNWEAWNAAKAGAK